MHASGPAQSSKGVSRSHVPRVQDDGACVVTTGAPEVAECLPRAPDLDLTSGEQTAQSALGLELAQRITGPTLGEGDDTQAFVSASRARIHGQRGTKVLARVCQVSAGQFQAPEAAEGERAPG